MKPFLFSILFLTGINSFAAVESAKIRVAKGAMPNPVLAPLGQLVNVETGEVLYVNSIISVLAPNQLQSDCVYQIHYTRDTVIKSRVRLVPPMVKLGCGHQFPIPR